ncbi:rod-binding protein [Geotalea sp. SG265]|uniref:rod-binding protein n=1 Tax=Geotalea sp. SG265 TaxID=2922867 RepID=UPI001FAF7F5A|nr:rod-binding protein [Geotalea sp. SG265]
MTADERDEPMEIKERALPTVPLETLRTQSLKLGQQSAEKKNINAAKVAKEFESLFVGMMLKSMRETVGGDTLTGGGHGEDVYRSLLDQEYAKAVAENGSLGLARIIEKQLTAAGAGRKKPGSD